MLGKVYLLFALISFLSVSECETTAFLKDPFWGRLKCYIFAVFLVARFFADYQLVRLRKTSQKVTTGLQKCYMLWGG